MYKDLIGQHLTEFLKEHQLSVPTFNLSYSDFEDNHYQTSLALSLRCDPHSIAEFLTTHYADFYESVSVTGKGFVSMRVKLAPFEKQSKPSQKVIVDYCGVNVAKQMHIGHIRSMFIGDYVVRLHESLGDDVTIFNHIGDWGNQFGYLLHYIQMKGLEHQLDNKSLTQYYKEAHLLTQSDEQFLKDSEQVAFQLQNKLDPHLVQLWEKLVAISLDEAEKTFQEFGLKINQQHTQGESFYAPFCQGVLDELLQKGLASREESGAVVAFFQDKSPIVLQKSNGNFLYPLYDLAAIQWRSQHLNPDKIIYVVDKRQSLHFEQVFHLARAAGMVNESVELIHLGFGTILGPDKKPLKTKSGTSLYLDDLLSQGKALLKANEYFLRQPEEIKEEILQKSIIGGMKYYDLKFNKTQDYIFDWEHVLNFSGGSAPYIQNALVRIDSIFEKIGLDIHQAAPLQWDRTWNPLEQTILFHCQKGEEIIQGSESTYASQILAENLLSICQLFHNYYEAEQVIGSPDEPKKLELLGFVYHTLIAQSDLLGIESYRCKNWLLKSKNKFI